MSPSLHVSICLSVYLSLFFLINKVRQKENKATQKQGEESSRPVSKAFRFRCPLALPDPLAAECSDMDRFTIGGCDDWSDQCQILCSFRCSRWRAALRRLEPRIIFSTPLKPVRSKLASTSESGLENVFPRVISFPLSPSPLAAPCQEVGAVEVLESC